MARHFRDAHQVSRVSSPTVVDAGGAVEIVSPELAPEERAALDRSAEVLRDAVRSLG